MKLSFFFILVFGYTAALAKVWTYAPTPNMQEGNQFIHPSKHYRVWVKEGEKSWIEVFVYEMDAQHYTNNSKTTAWVNFSFDGVIEVRVEKLEGVISLTTVLPRNSGMKFSDKAGNTATYIVEKPGQFSIEFGDQLFVDHPLLLFANAPEENVPDVSASNLLYFGPGLHEIGERYLVPTGSTVYIDGGAYVKGQFFAEHAKDIVIRGRGILSGEDYAARTQDHMISMRQCNNITVEGITIIHAPRFMITLSGKQHHITNVKMMGWWFSTDGTSTGEDALIENCFFKVNDDAVKLYQNNTIVRRCVIWQMENGAPFQLGWNGGNDYGNCHVYDIDVIRVEHIWDNENEAVICAIHGGKGIKQNFLFEDIRIEHGKWRIFHLVTKPNRWGNWDPERGEMGKMIFRNISMKNAQAIPSLVMGHDKQHPVYDLSFTNITTGGRQWTGTRDEIIIDKETTRNIRFD